MSAAHRRKNYLKFTSVHDLCNVRKFSLEKRQLRFLLINLIWG